jgi:hypothetical protein
MSLTRSIVRTRRYSSLRSSATPPSSAADFSERRVAIAGSRVIWDKSRNPTKHVSDALEIERWQLRQAIHKIKARANLGSTDKVVIHSDGKVTGTDGSEIGNVHDEI